MVDLAMPGQAEVCLLSVLGIESRKFLRLYLIGSSGIISHGLEQILLLGMDFSDYSPNQVEGLGSHMLDIVPSIFKRKAGTPKLRAIVPVVSTCLRRTLITWQGCLGRV